MYVEYGGFRNYSESTTSRLDLLFSDGVALGSGGASLVAQMVKNLPAMRKTWVRSLGWEDPLEKGMATTPVFLSGESHGQRNLAGHSPWGNGAGHN